MNNNVSINCSGCGSPFTYSPGSMNVKCSHCGLENVIESAVTVLETAPEYIVPLGVDEKMLRRAAQTFMSSGKLTPDDLLDSAKFTKIDLFYVPAYLFKGSYRATWNASFGYDRQEQYTAYESQYDSRLNRTVQVPVTKTKTVTDWRPASGSDSGNFELSAYAGSKQPMSVAQLVQDMAWDNGKEFDPSFVAGFRFEEIEKSDDVVYKEAVVARVNSIIESGVKSHAQGDRQQGWSWNASIDKSSISYLLPVGWVKYEYGGKEYNFWLDGISGSKHVADTLPLDSKRRTALILGYVPAGVGAFSYAASSGADSDFYIVLTLFALSYAIARHLAILDFSKKRREATLARKIVEESSQAELSDDQKASLTTAYSEVKPGFLADFSRDKVRIPVIAVSILILPWILQIPFSGSSSSNTETTAGVTHTSSARDGSSDQAGSASSVASPQPDSVASAASPPVSAPSVQAYDLEKGSSERKLILDAVRPMVERLLNPPVTFQVDTIRVAGDFAFLRMTPIRPTGEAIDTATTNLPNKDSGVLTQILLQRNGTSWSLSDGVIGASNQWGIKHCGTVPRGLIDVCP